MKKKKYKKMKKIKYLNKKEFKNIINYLQQSTKTNNE
jgi:hypothetical protein